MDTQLAVIGGGPGGYAAAFLAADRGMQVALVDLEPQLGGVCLLRGCIPSKALLHVAKAMAEAKHLAVGDVAGESILAHKATHKGKVAVEALAGGPAAFELAAIPAVVFTDPEIAWAGLTETEAKAHGRAVEVATFPWTASGRAQAVGRAEGMTKWLIDPETDRLLGCGIVGVGHGVRSSPPGSTCWTKRVRTCSCRVLRRAVNTWGAPMTFEGTCASVVAVYTGLHAASQAKSVHKSGRGGSSQLAWVKKPALPCPPAVRPPIHPARSRPAASQKAGLPGAW